MSSERWFAWANRHGFGFRLGLIEVQVYLYTRRDGKQKREEAS